MRTIIGVLMIAACSLVSMPTDVSSAAAGPKKKPRSPVLISIRPADDRLDPAGIRPGDEVSLKAVVTSSLNDPEMRITITLSGGTRLLSGELSWSGPAVKGETTTVPFVVQAPLEGKGKVKALVEIGPKGAGHFSSRAEYELGSPEKQKSPEPRGVKKDSKGRGVVEYR